MENHDDQFNCFVFHLKNRQHFDHQEQCCIFGALSEQTGNQGVSTQNKSTTTISTLSRQLAASASRAEERDSTLSRSQLAEKAKSILEQVAGDSYFANKAQHDSEVPKTNDSELLARAKQATAYVNDAAKGGHTEKNPFSGLSRDQLANIIYDDSGAYTVNERRAASYEADRQEEAWRKQVAAKARAEYNETGEMGNLFKDVLEHFKSWLFMRFGVLSD